MPVLINLAVGLVLTGVSMLLQPKPQSIRAHDREQRSIVGSNQEGRTRFANTIGFDGVPQLAQLGSRIPLVFGDYREEQQRPKLAAASLSNLCWCGHRF